MSFSHVRLYAVEKMIPQKRRIRKMFWRRGKCFGIDRVASEQEQPSLSTSPPNRLNHHRLHLFGAHQGFQNKASCIGRNFRRFMTLAKSPGASVRLSAWTLRSSQSARPHFKADATHHTQRSSRGNCRIASSSGDGSLPCITAIAKFRDAPCPVMSPVHVRRVLDGVR